MPRQLRDMQVRFVQQNLQKNANANDKSAGSRRPQVGARDGDHETSGISGLSTEMHLVGLLIIS